MSKGKDEHSPRNKRFVFGRTRTEGDLVDNRQELLRRPEEFKKRQRLERLEKQTERIIKDDIARDKRCCMDKGKLPDYFVRCSDCSKPLDSDGEIC